MNATIVDWLLRCYPQAWRDRYAAELTQLVEDSGAGVRDIPGIVRGAYQAHRHPQRFGLPTGGIRRWVTRRHLAGLAAAVGGALWIAVYIGMWLAAAQMSFDPDPHIVSLLAIAGPFLVLSILGLVPRWPDRRRDRSLLVVAVTGSMVGAGIMSGMLVRNGLDQNVPLVPYDQQWILWMGTMLVLVASLAMRHGPRLGRGPGATARRRLIRVHAAGRVRTGCASGRGSRPGPAGVRCSLTMYADGVHTTDRRTAFTPWEHAMSFDWAEMEKDLYTQVRTGDGSVTRGFFAGKPVMLLTTTGAKSGEPRTTPLCYSIDHGTMVIIASKAGSTSHPAWYLNIVKDPVVTVEAGGEKYQARASVVADPAERRRIYDQHAELHTSFTEYEAKAGDRVIPVIVLDRLPEGALATAS